MPARSTTLVGAPCWIDLMSSDKAASTAFYCALFGWTFTDPVAEFGGYQQVLREGVPIGGLMASGPGGGADGWSVHLATDDAQKTVEVAVACGGQVVVPPMAVGDLGTMGGVVGPDGAFVGLWQADTFAGTGVFTEPGAPSWFELHTRDDAASLAFLADAFRWEPRTVSDVPEFCYSTLDDGDQQLAGVMDASGFLPDGEPAAWSFSLGVDDADEVLARVVALGGTVLQPAEDTPYGRLAAAADPLGARFKLVAPDAAVPARDA